MALVNPFGGPIIMSGSQLKYRREFNDAALASWEKTESGITIPAPSGGNLVVPLGVTPNAEGSITTLQQFGAPFAVAVGVQMSQKIAQNEVYIELVACAENGVLDETVVAAWRLSGTDSTTATVARTEVRNGGAARLQSANITGLPSQTSVGAVYEITLESDEVWFTAKSADSNAARVIGSVRNSVAPDPTLRYRIRLRVKNGSVAPASSTSVTWNFLTAVDFTDIKTEVTGGNGNTASGQAIPVHVVAGSGGSSTTPAIAASTTVAGTSVAKVLSAASTNPTLVKSTSGRLYGYQLANTTAAWKFLRLYNLTVAPTVGTSVPFMVVPIPPNGMVDIHNTVPVAFATGISYAITGASPDLDATAVAAGDVVGHLVWL